MFDGEHQHSQRTREVMLQVVTLIYFTRLPTITAISGFVQALRQHFPRLSYAGKHQIPRFSGTRMHMQRIFHLWLLLPVMWSETVGLRTRTVSDQEIGHGLARCGLGRAGLVYI